MINAKFHWLLTEPKDASGKRPLWTVAKVAEALYINRPHLNDVLNNKPNHGGQTRPKLVKFFKRHFPEKWPEILQSLGWDEKGRIVPRPTFHGEHVLAHGHHSKGDA